ncbi:MAG: shikimate dehydrogenase [Betaproteobacteria bacterium RIFCSPLOWO2_12_FULL_62_13]|nr:MAG: shikimate dehydrogenase [Betaproteobacteria bacterium RIFCSPLOWO2_12_FULL_62_13]
MTDKYAVIGNPVAHSKSPLIHAEFARQTGQDISYIAVLAPPDGFRAAVLAFRDAGGRGINVTLPFKHEAWNLATAHRGYAFNAGAVNTFEFRGSEIIGHNTDGIGLVRDIKENLGCSIQGRRVLLMGAGGASYGVMEPLLREQPGEIAVANRTVDKAVTLVAYFEKFQTFALRGVTARPYAGLRGAQFDVLINATSAGLSGEMPPLPGDIFAPDALAYDMVYGRTTPFLEFARAQGARAADGIGMLVEQAAEAFFIWRSVRPQTASLIAMLRKA